MEKILDWLKGLGQKLLDFWNKYSAKQKTVIISVVIAIGVLLGVLIYILTRPVYVNLATVSDAKTASDIITALNDASITNTKTTEGDVTTIDVQQSDYSDAVLLIGSNDLLDSSDMSYTEALNNDMSTSSDEKSLKANLAKQSAIRKSLQNYNGVKDATVFIDPPKDDGLLASESKDASVSVCLDLKDDSKIDTEAARAIAYYLANAVGSSNTDNIIITDTKSNLLYGKVEDNTLGGSISDAADYKQKLSNTISKNVSELLLKYGFDDVQIGDSNIVYNMDKITELVEDYSIDEGRDTGYLDNDYSYESNNGDASGGVPGTDSNADDTDYMLQDSTGSNSSTTLDKNQYLTDKTTQNIIREVGAVQPENSSMAIIITRYNIVTEQSLEDSGALADTTFEEYAEANKAQTSIDVDAEVLDLVSKTTGIATGNLSISAFEKPIYQANEESSVNVTNYLMIILAVLIAALLVFVIIRGTSPVEVTELEPELSVEDLLTTTEAENPLDDIEVNEKSELRMLIEKFVEDNPEAVALLLRNWLNEDWG